MDNVFYAYLWLIIFILFGIIELITPQFITIWFAVGALITIPLAVFSVPFPIQIIVFILASIMLLAATRPLYKKYIKKRYVPTNADALISTTAIVIEEINNDDAVGIVKARGQIWSARTINGEKIEIGEKVDIISIEGVKLIVSRHNL